MMHCGMKLIIYFQTSMVQLNYNSLRCFPDCSRIVVFCCGKVTMHFTFRLTMLTAELWVFCFSGLVVVVEVRGGGGGDGLWSRYNRIILYMTFRLSGFGGQLVAFLDISPLLMELLLYKGPPNDSKLFKNAFSPTWWLCIYVFGQIYRASILIMLGLLHGNCLHSWFDYIHFHYLRFHPIKIYFTLCIFVYAISITLNDANLFA